MAAPRLYTELADWWPLLSAPEDYAEEAAIYADLLAAESESPISSILELGCGGGNNASHLKQRFARLVLTDSGGVQKEAYWYKVPCLTLRDSTEWVETVELGWNRLVPQEPEALVAAVRDAVAPADHPDLYGDGRAAEHIADLLATIGGP